MPGEYPRSHRVADHIQRELAELLRTGLRDPRLSPMLTISSVEVTRDLSVAKVYYTVLDEAEQADSRAALKSATGFLRSQLARSLNMRSVPILRFYHDDSVATGARMSALIDAAMASNSTDDSAACDVGAGDAAESGSGKPTSLVDDRHTG